MTTTGLRVHRDTYLDSLLLMTATVSMDELDGVEWAGAVMASEAGLADLADAGVHGDQLAGLGANDLVLAVRAGDDKTLDAALRAGEEAAFAERSPATERPRDEPPQSLAEAVRREAGSTVALISVPGEYAALETHHALRAGLHVLLFSDGVPVAEEVELKERAQRLGLLVMGPGAGTSVLGGTGLGFANVLGAASADDRAGAVGVVAAAGTGAQEVSALLDRWGVPVSQVIGVGGRDLSAAVGGRMARSAVRLLDADPGTAAVLLVSKPPDAQVAAEVLGACQETPAVAVFLGQDAGSDEQRAATLERGALTAAHLVGRHPPTPGKGLATQVEAAVARLGTDRRTVRGLFSGGTLCYEAQVLLERLLGPVHSNEPLRDDRGLPAPDGAHVLLDLGAEEYTRGRPHPMIDPSGRCEMLADCGNDETLAVVLLDVVLGYGAHDDPAAALAPVCEQVMADGGPQVVAYVLGTEGDPQGYTHQREVLTDAGCLVPETNARAAFVAAALALRRPELAEAAA